ncbi:MAG: NAD(P)-dependent oxidoreductase [Ignavibacteria bacterium]
MKLKSEKCEFIFIADEFHQKGIDLLKREYNTLYLNGLTTRDLLKLIASKTHSANKTSALIIRSTRKLGADRISEIKNKTNIRLICTVSSGFDNIDVLACSKLNIKVLNVPGGNMISAAEFTMSLILALAKNLFPANNMMNKGLFDNSGISNFELSGKTLGVIGVGRVGSYTAKFAKAFGMNIIGNDIDPKVRAAYKWIKFVSLNSLLRKSDVVTLHVPLDNTTVNLINGNNIKLLSGNSMLINCSRGGTVNEKALISALKRGKIRYAGIDVFLKEPGFASEFTKLNNVILTPHLAGKTAESKIRMSIQTAENIYKYYTGKRLTLKFVN